MTVTSVFQFVFHHFLHFIKLLVVAVVVTVVQKKKVIMLGIMASSRARGRPRVTWMDHIRAWTYLSMGE